MPYAHNDYYIQPENDRRRKLSEEIKDEIRKNPEGLSQRKLAALYGVSRRLITFILDPQKLVENKKARAERGGSKQYYNKNAWREALRDHRRYKQELMLAGKLVEKERPCQ